MVPSDLPGSASGWEWWGVARGGRWDGAPAEEDV